MFFFRKCFQCYQTQEMLHYLKQNVVHIDVLLAKSGKINFTIYAKGQKNIQGHYDVVLFRQKYKKNRLSTIYNHRFKKKNPV